MSSFKPYDYQLRVGNSLLSGKSVVLQAPTGAGKTYTALTPFIHGLRSGHSSIFPRKCIYVVPMRVLANQFLEKFKEYAAPYQRVFGRDITYSILTGDRPDDRRYESDLLFCTIDQFLSSYLTMPYGLPNRLSNLNLGAITGSYLVFDEFHLLEPESTLPTAWHAIQQLSRISPVLLMTATFSKQMLAALAERLNACVEVVPPEEAHQIENRKPTVQPRRRFWETENEPINANAVLANHKSRSLVLCNTVKTAQHLFQEIQQQIEQQAKPIRLLLLHSRFLTEDRRRIEADLHHLFGNAEDCDATGSVIAIATQTIEVGMDITSEVLHTELSPASALIQRAGRCARYPGEQGRVIVYPVEKYLPYSSQPGWKEEMIQAFAWLQAHSGEVFDFSKEQEFVDAVAAPRDMRVLEALFSGQADRKREIQRVLLGGRNASDGRLLIRDAESLQVLIHDDPEQLLNNPKSASGFQLQPGTIAGQFKQWQERANDLQLDWIAKRLIEDSSDHHEENRTVYDWETFSDPQLIWTTRTIVIHTALAGYDRNQGLLLDRGETGFVSSLPNNATQHTWEGFTYSLESYEEHISRVLTAFEQTVIQEFQSPARALEKASGGKLKPGSLLDAARLVCLLHDVGKLSQGWQAWSRAHQQAVGKPVAPSFALAHTDTNFHDETLRAAAAQAARQFPKPHHASEGAIAAAPILFALLEPKELAQAAVMAIARHHTPFAEEIQPYTLEASAILHIQETLELLPVEIRSKLNANHLRMTASAKSSLQPLFITPDQEIEWFIYALLVRALRRADQQGTAYASHH